jgi:pimeloyl-ACP methyl ester carboxylesterase
MKKFLFKWGWVFLLIPLLLAGGFIYWALTPLGPMPEAEAALISDEIVEVQTEPWLIFQPTDREAATGVIIYPGGRVDPVSYSPPARELAARGYLVVIVPMPLNLAVFAPAKAQQVIDAFPDITHWLIGGHSLGGAMAANYALKNPDLVDGLFFWAAYPASSDDLSTHSILVASIYGTLDGLATKEKIDASIPLLPEDTIWTPIQGGNHAQFGWYGEQPGDNPATITREDQQAQALESMQELLDLLDG